MNESLGDHRHSASVVADDCLVCGTQLAGWSGRVLGWLGIRRSSRNPNVCNRCDMHLLDGSLSEVSILFADLAAFTSLTNTLGPERTHEVVNAFLLEATRAIVANDGVVDKYMGDAVMALFNVPITHADHGARAVRASQDLINLMPELSHRFGFQLEVRVGVATGAVRVGRLGSQDVRDMTVIGDAVNRAARLQTQAHPGEMVVDAGIYSQVAALFPPVASESLLLKGFSEPVMGYRLRTQSPPLLPLKTEFTPQVKRSWGLGSLVVSLLGAPCAIGAAVNPAAVALALGSAAGSASLIPSHSIDHPAVRIPLTLLSLTAISANLYTLWHARRARMALQEAGGRVTLSKKERNRERWVWALSVGALALMGLEFLAHHFIMHHPLF